ncbi:MAG: hypothetical protein CXR31_11680 [Geobacter sp.]|nr:MAG: hypothetical protein CXR31_11680 [Geobacter sp.]
MKDSDILDYIQSKADSFFGRIAASATRGLGHACVADFPDRPYLEWEFSYENGIPSPLRKNQETYMQACENLFDFFSKFKAAAPQYAEVAEARNFETIRATVAEILAFEGKKDERGEKWQGAAIAGRLLFAGAIPEYRHNAFREELEAVSKLTERNAHNQRVWHFTRGVEVMRGMILNELLPERNLIG